jgi:diguanylate cyclase (GGDEF)-like protein/PAS domain S-box-containing protein
MKPPSKNSLGSEAYQDIFAEAPDAMLISDEHGIIIQINRQAECLLGYQALELIGRSIEILIPERFREAHQQLYAKFAAAPVARPMGTGREIQALRKDNSLVDVDISLNPIQTKQGLFFVSALYDNTFRKQKERELQKSQALIAAANDAIISKTLDGVIESWNQGAEGIFGYTAEEIIGKPMRMLFPPDRLTEELEILSRIACYERIEHFETVRLCKDGRLIDVSVNISPILDLQGRMIGVSSIARDITERKSAEAEIKKLAFYDPLTRLPNRRLLQDRLQHGIEVSQRKGQKIALLMLDLDHFKEVNDSLGHLAGDELLQQVAARITARLRSSDTLARLGGDEFVVLLEDLVCRENAGQIAEKIITDLGNPFQLSQSDEVRIGASIGISLYPQHGDNQEMLIDRADAALYQAKVQGRGCFTYYRFPEYQADVPKKGEL